MTAKISWSGRRAALCLATRRARGEARSRAAEEDGVAAVDPARPGQPHRILPALQDAASLMAGEASGPAQLAGTVAPPGACGFLLCSGLAVAGPRGRPAPIASPQASGRSMARNYILRSRVIYSYILENIQLLLVNRLIFLFFLSHHIEKFYFSISTYIEEVLQQIDFSLFHGK